MCRKLMDDRTPKASSTAGLSAAVVPNESVRDSRGESGGLLSGIHVAFSTSALVPVGLVSLFCAAVLFGWLGSSPLWDRDEPRNAGCAAEMLASGNLIVPIFNDQLRFQKPVLTYWLMIVAYQLFGISEFAARFFSALLALGTCLMTWRIGWRLLDWRCGMLAAMILPGTVMFGVAARAATPDAPLLFCFVAVLLAFVEMNGSGWRQNENEITGRFPFWWAVALYGLAGLGALAKGLAGVVPPLAVIGMFLMVERGMQARFLFPNGAGYWGQGLKRIGRIVAPRNFLGALFSMRPVLGSLVILLVAGPWYVAVGMATEGEFLRLFFLREHLGRATEAFEGHSAGFWFYPAVLLAGFFPWSVFAVPVTGDLILGNEPDGRRARWFLMGWVGVVVGLFSLASTKLPSYVTPCYPALALLTARGVIRFAAGASAMRDGWFKMSLWTVAGCSLLVGAGLWWLGAEYLGGQGSLAWAVIPLAVVAGWAIWQSGFCGLTSRDRRLFPWMMAGGAGAFCLMLLGWGSSIVGSTRQTESLIAMIRKEGTAARVASYRCLESSWIFYGQHPIFELTLPGEPSGLPPGPRMAWETLPKLSPESLANSAGRTLIVTTDAHVAELQRRLGGRGTVIASAKDFLKERRLVLLAVGEWPEKAFQASKKSDSGLR